jgi:hypothetical protein
MGAGSETGSLVEQVLDGAAGLDRQDIDERFGERAAEVEPETVGQGAQPGTAGDFQKRAADFGCVLGWSSPEPRFLATPGPYPWRTLAPSLEPAFDEKIQ